MNPLLTASLALLLGRRQAARIIKATQSVKTLLSENYTTANDTWAMVEGLQVRTLGE
jgi:hypothetical protein